MNFALVGCGRIAKRHAELLGLGQIAGARLAAVCDIDAARAKQFGERFDVPWFTDMDEMMRAQPIDVVSVLTPSGLHAEHAVRLAKHGRHILVEKPMALTLEDADRMIEACRDAGCQLFVVKQNRFNVPVTRLRKELDSKRFGKLTLGTVRVRWNRDQSYYDQDSWRGTWKLDGGVLTNQASHHIDMLVWMMGDVESVYAKTSTFLVNTETEDTGVAIVKFRSGALGVIEATTAVRPKDLEGSISILGERGTVEIAGFAVNKIRHWEFVDATDEDRLVVERYSVNPPNVYGFGHKVYLEHVVDSVRDGVKSMVDGMEGRKSLELITAIYESTMTGAEVRFPFEAKQSRLGK